MPIPEQQLETWSKQGSVQQSSETYKSIKTTLEDNNAPYSNRQCYTFLQGSYGNDTNIHADSDVDIVICTTTLFYYNIDGLGDSEQQNFHAAYPSASSYSYPGRRCAARCGVSPLLRAPNGKQHRLLAGYRVLEVRRHQNRQLPEAALRQLYRETSKHKQLVQTDRTCLQEHP